MGSSGPFRLFRLLAGSRLARRLRDERGIALVMAIGILMVLGITAASVAYYTSAQGRNTSLNENRRDAYALAEAGINAALSVLQKALDPTTGTALPAQSSPATITLEGGSASYYGELDTSTYTWTITSIGTAPNPTGAASPLEHTLHRTVTIQGISDGATTSAWSRFYQDSTQCLTLDTVEIPGSVAVKNCLVLKNGAKITNSDLPDNPTSVDVGGNVTVESVPLVAGPEGGTSASSGWTTPSNIASSNGSDASASVAAGGTSASLDAANFGFNVPSDATILGIEARIERAQSPQAVAFDYQNSTSNATAGTTLSWSHTAANQSNRVIVVGVTAEYTSSACQASWVRLGTSQYFTKIAERVTGGSPYVCTSLWYLVAPATGTQTITVTYQNWITNKTAGSVGLYNVEQSVDNWSSNVNNWGTTSTSLSTFAANSWVVDVFATGNGNSLTSGSGQTRRWTRTSGSTTAGGMSTEQDASPSWVSMTWSSGTSINKSAIIAAVFAPAPANLVDGDVYLLKGGNATGVDHANPTPWTTSDVTRLYGANNDLWGTTWTPSEINASNFGLRLIVSNPSAAALTAYVDYVSLTVYYAVSSVGVSASPIAQANVQGTCTLGTQTGHIPCSSADRVFASTVTTAAQNLGKPTIDLEYWFQNAKPGPKHPCTNSPTNMGQLKFDNDNSLSTNNSVHYNDTEDDMTPTHDYTCEYVENGKLVGEISWNHTTRVFKIKGTVFFDGDVRFDGDGEVVHYQGRGIIYAAGDIEYDEQVCAGGSGTTSCLGNIQSWDPTQNLLILLTGGNSEYDQGGTRCYNVGEPDCPNGWKAAGFQGIVYSNGDCLIHQTFQLSGPVMCNTISVINGQSGDGDFGQDSWPTFYTWPYLGELVDGQIYIGVDNADNFQLTLGPTDG